MELDNRNHHKCLWSIYQARQTRLLIEIHVQSYVALLFSRRSFRAFKSKLHSSTFRHPFFLLVCKSFDCIQSIVHGGFTVYQVICTRGRLRGRILALKKVGIVRPVYMSSALTFKNRSRDQVNQSLAQYLPPLSIKLFIIQILYPCIPLHRRYLLIITYSNFALKETCLTSSLRETHPSYLSRSLGVF